MQEYVNAAMEIAQEYQIFGLNLYTDMQIDSVNHPSLLVDGCHLNEQGRFNLGQLLGAILNRIP